MPELFDVAVVGLGAAGSAALRFVARSGAKAVGVDRFAPPHAHGSSHGETRLCRVSHAEGEDYVPLMKRSIALWKEIEHSSGQRLLEPTGILYAGATSGQFVTKTLDHARQHGVAVSDVNQRSGLQLPPSWIRYLETESGFLYPERAIAALLGEARAAGAVILTDRGAISIDHQADCVVIALSGREVRAKTAIVAAGAWTPELVPSLRRVLHTQRRTLHWFDDPRGSYGLNTGFKPFLFETEDGRLPYGFPDVGSGVKIAEHRIAGDDGPIDDIDRAVSGAERRGIEELARPYFSDLGEITRSAVCVYPMSRDEHFVIGRHPKLQRIILAAGLSGHGFKFAPVIGEAVVAMAKGKVPQVNLDPFSPARFGELIS